MVMNLRDTIVALATPMGRAGIGVVRLSGGESRRIAEAILSFPHGARWKPWSSQLSSLTDESGEHIDQVVATYFEKPASYTAEDVVEIACHGAPVVLKLCLERAIRAGARCSKPESILPRTM
jgi:tRNA modification GTPase